MFVCPSPIQGSLVIGPPLMSEESPTCSTEGPLRLRLCGGHGGPASSAAPLFSGAIHGDYTGWARDHTGPVKRLRLSGFLDKRNSSWMPGRSVVSRRRGTSGSGASGEHGAQSRERKLTLGTVTQAGEDMVGLQTPSCKITPVPRCLSYLASGFPSAAEREVTGTRACEGMIPKTARARQRGTG